VYVPNVTAINAVAANQTDTFAVTASDGSLTGTGNLTVNIAGANDAPVLTVPTAITLTDTVAKDTFANQTGTLVSADAENTVRTYGITGGGAGATVGSVVYDVSKVGTYGTLHVKSTTGEYVYVANATAINALGANQTENFVVTATDGGTPVTQTLTVNVTGANDSPVWVGSSSAYTIIIGQPVSASANPGIDFADADTGHAAISYTLFSVGGVQGGTIPGVTLNANGTLTGTPTNVAAETYPKDYVVVVRAKDGNDPTLYTDHTYTIHALKAPAVQSISVLDGTSSNTTALGKAGETLDVSVVFSEVVTVVGSPTITLSINGKTATATYNGTGTGTSTLHFTVAIPSGAGYDGSNIALTGVTANVSGASVIGQTSGQAWDATPMPAAFTGYTVDTTMPTITSTYSVNENTLADTATKTIALAATNETGAVTWSSLAGTDAASFTLGTGANLGKLVFNGASDFEAKSSFSVTLTGTDAAGNAKTGQVVTVNINNVNEAPAVVAAIPDASADVGVAMTSINAATAFADPDSLASGMGTLTYSFVGTAPAGITIDPATGVISGTPTAAGNYNVEVKASDGTNSVIDTFALNVVSVPLLVAPLLTATQALDDVTNLDVKSALVISFDGPITLNTTGTQHIKIFDDMNSTGWNHTASAAVLNNTVVDTYNNDVDITLTNGVVTLVTVGGADLTSRFNLTTSVVVNGNNLVIDLKPAVEANHLSVAAISKASTAFDWDFGAAYHVELDADLVTRGGLGNAATTDSTVLNFTTVTPVLTTSGAVAAKMMDASGTLATLSDGYKYLNGNQGNSQATPYGATLDLSGGNYAVVLDSQGTNKTNLGGWIRIQNFSLDGGALNQTDLIYMDNHGDQSILTTNSLSVSNPSSWNNDTVITTDSIRKLNAASGGAAMWVTFETPAVSGWTKPTNDASFENVTHMNYDAIIFG
jgi:VCBS repeat-containing protein